MAEEEQLGIFRNLPSLSSTCFAGRITKQFPSISAADVKGNCLSKTKQENAVEAFTWGRCGAASAA